MLPPNLVAVLPEMMEFVTVSVPLLLKAPPSPEVFAPETVTPEMDKLPPESILKMLKSRLVLPLLPLMVREEAPGPVMVRVSAEVVGAMVGSDFSTPSRVIVPVTLKFITSSPGVVLACMMASLNEVKPSVGSIVSAVVSTTIGVFEGVILSSNLRSSNPGEDKALRAFLF